MLEAVFKLQLEFFPGLDPTNQASRKLNIVFTRSQRLAVPESHVWTKWILWKYIGLIDAKF